MATRRASVTAGRGRIRIGCSGWQYAHWRGTFYPQELPIREWLAYYTARFATVEVNNTFYRLPARATFRAWADAAPPAFVFTIKASRFLTHLKQLHAPAEPLRRLTARTSALGTHHGPILYQLPARMRCDLPRLTAFLQALRRRAPRLRHAIEFRHTSWYDDSVFALLARYRVALCLHDKSEGGYLGEPIGPFAYVRFHGPSGAYHGGYAASDLAAWAERMRGWSTKGLDAYGYFNNDVAGMAPHDAATLIGLVNRA